MSDSFFTRLFFESLPTLLMAEVLALAVALAAHRRHFTERTRRGIWGTLAVCAFLIAVQMLVMTDRERLEQVVETLARAVDDGDMDAIDERVDETFEGFGNPPQNKRSFIAEVNQDLQRWQIDAAKVFHFKIDLEGDIALVAFSATCDWRSGGQVQYAVLSMWKLRFIRRTGGWKIQRIESAKFGPGGTWGWRDVRNL